MRSAGRITIAVMLGICVTAAMAPGQSKQASTEKGKVSTAAEGQWMPLPDIFPAGGQMKVVHGNPAVGPVDLYFRFPAGYGVPWHFHTPVEKVMMDRGTMQFEMRGGSKASIQEGGYIYFPFRAPHQATCTSTSDCLFYLTSSDAFDIHLVDENWNVTRRWTAGEKASVQKPPVQSDRAPAF